MIKWTRIVLHKLINHLSWKRARKGIKWVWFESFWLGVMLLWIWIVFIQNWFGFMSQNTPETRFVVVISISIKTLHQCIHSNHYIQLKIYPYKQMSDKLTPDIKIYKREIENRIPWIVDGQDERSQRRKKEQADDEQRRL